MYNRFAESSRVNYFRNFGNRAANPELKAEWDTLMTPRGIGLILKSIKTDYKFVSRLKSSSYLSKLT